MFGISKRTADPSIKTSHSKKSRYYILDSDGSSSEQDVQSDVGHISDGATFTNRKEVEENTTDSDSIIVLAKQPEEKWEQEVVDKVGTAKALFHSMPIEVSIFLYSFLRILTATNHTISPLNDPP